MLKEANVTNLKVGDKVIPKNELRKKLYQEKGIVYFIVKEFKKGSMTGRDVVLSSKYTFKGKEKGLVSFYIDNLTSELFFYEG